MNRTATDVAGRPSTANDDGAVAQLGTFAEEPPVDAGGNHDEESRPAQMEGVQSSAAASLSAALLPMLPNERYMVPTQQYSDQENHPPGAAPVAPIRAQRRFNDSQLGPLSFGLDREPHMLSDMAQTGPRLPHQQEAGSVPRLTHALGDRSNSPLDIPDPAGTAVLAPVIDQSTIDPSLRRFEASGVDQGALERNVSNGHAPEQDSEPAENTAVAQDHSQSQVVNQKAKRAVAIARKAKPSRERKPWTPQDVEQLIRYVGDLGTRYAAIREQADEDDVLHRRSQVDLKDKVRNIKMDYLKSNTPLPKNFSNFPLNKKDKARLIQLGIDYETANIEEVQAGVHNTGMLVEVDPLGEQADQPAYVGGPSDSPRGASQSARSAIITDAESSYNNKGGDAPTENMEPVTHSQPSRQDPQDIAVAAQRQIAEER